MNEELVTSEIENLSNDKLKKMISIYHNIKDQTDEVKATLEALENELSIRTED